MNEIQSPSEEWSAIKKVVVIFFCIYWAFYTLPFFIDSIPVVDYLTEAFHELIMKFAHFNASFFMGLDIPESPQLGGSGDKLLDYVTAFTYLLLSLLLTPLLYWFLRKKSLVQQFYGLMIISMRYYLGIMLLNYGFAKFFNLQFLPLNIYGLEQNFGDSSPMGLLWTFIGHSRAFTLFTAIAEITAGLLLLFRKTYITGALIAFVIMLNVFLMNMCYDVPVKLFSLHLTLMSLFILAPSVSSIFNFIVLRKNITLQIIEIQFPKKWMRITRHTLKVLILLLIPVASLWGQIEYYNEQKISFQDLNANYTSTQFIKNNDSLPSTDTTRWDKLIIDEGYAKIITTANKSSWYTVDVDTIGRKLKLKDNNDTTLQYTFTYVFINKQLHLKGIFKKDTLNIDFSQKRKEEYPLNERGFHWISETPYNR